MHAPVASAPAAIPAPPSLFPADAFFCRQSFHACSLCLAPPLPLPGRFRQTERLAGSAASLVNSAVSGLAWAGSKVAGGGEASRARHTLHGVGREVQPQAVGAQEACCGSSGGHTAETSAGGETVVTPAPTLHPLCSAVAHWGGQAAGSWGGCG